MALTLSVSPVSRAEGNSGDTIFSYTFTLSGGSPTTSANLIYDFSANSTANASDFSNFRDQYIVAFAPGETQKTLDIVVKGDATVEPDETFTYRAGFGSRISDPNGLPQGTDFRAIRNSSFSGTIVNDDFNQVPTAVNFVNITTALDENTSTATRIKVADVTLTDDGQGTNTLSLTGSDAAAFELDVSTLYLKAGTRLDFETQSSYSVTVNADDAAVGATPDASSKFTLAVKDVVENTAPIAVNNRARAFRNSPTTIAAATLLANDTDPDAGTILKITNVSNATGGTVALNSSGDVVFTAAKTGDASFEYSLSDGSLTSTATVALSVGLKLNGGKGSDRLRGSHRDDILNGKGGADALYGKNGSDILNGGSGADALYGGKGNDTLNGGSSNDLLLGGAGDDLLDGGSSADALYGGKGNDRLTGGAGADLFAFAAGDGSDTITDFTDRRDRIGLVGLRFNQVAISSSGSDTLIKYGNETIATLTGVRVSLITAADFITA